mgnify:CR=1 FL=1
MAPFDSFLADGSLIDRGENDRASSFNDKGKISGHAKAFNIG